MRCMMPTIYVSLQLVLFKLYDVPWHSIQKVFCFKELKTLSSWTMQV
jgi:hypothetical protein